MTRTRPNGTTAVQIRPTRICTGPRLSAQVAPGALRNAVKENSHGSPAKTHSGADQGLMIGRAAAPLLLVLALEELDVNFGAVDANQFASAIGEAGRRQQQKELLEIESFDGAVDGQYGIVVRNGVEQAVAAPRSINTHDTDAISATEGHPFQPLGVVCHCSKRPIAAALGMAAATAGLFAGVARTLLGR